VSRLLSLAALLSACTGAEPTTPPPPREKVLVIAANADMQSMNPLTTTLSDDRNVIANLMMPIYQFRFDCGATAEPGLAKQWSWSDDGRTLRVDLRDDITWSDGPKVTAHDIAFTYQLMANPALGGGFASILRHFEPGAGPRVIDDHTLEWGFTSAYDHTAQLAHTSLFYLPKHIFESVPPEAIAAHSYATNPLSTGPWVFTDRSPGAGWMLRPNKAFTGPEDMRARLDRVEFRVLPDDNTRKLELVSGGVDMVTGLTPADVDALRRQRPDLTFTARGMRRLEQLALNPTVEPLGDPEVRRGLAAALDIDRMFNTMMRDSEGKEWGRRSVGPISPEFCQAAQRPATPIATDPQRARDALAAQGWRDTDNDGYVDKNGQKLRLSLLYASEHAPAKQIAELSQVALAAVGVELVLDPAPKAVAMERRKKLDYQIAYAAMDTALFLDPSAAWRTPPPNSPAPMNLTRYSNVAVDALIDAGMAEPDPQVAAAYWAELQRIVYEDQPSIFLWWTSDLVVVADRFSGTSIDLISPLHNLHGWDIQDAQ
jgi:peptide/nickel transport system substrate-binding protein